MKQQKPPRTMFEIDQDWMALNELVDSIGGDLSDPQVDAAFQALSAELFEESGAKLDGSVNYIRFCEGRIAAALAEAEQYAAEAARFRGRAESYESRMNRTKKMIVESMTLKGLESFETPKGRKVRLQDNAAAPVEYDNLIKLADVPDEFIHKELHRGTVLQALKEGRSLPFARFGKKGRHMRVDYRAKDN